eukprot:87090-Hanusia_phi.AAC.1
MILGCVRRRKCSLRERTTGKERAGGRGGDGNWERSEGWRMRREGEEMGAGDCASLLPGLILSCQVRQRLCPHQLLHQRGG